MPQCTVYRSSRRQGTYLYLAENTEFDSLPGDLRAAFGSPVKIMDLELSETRPLARADVVKVIEDLESQGFYLQLPPTADPLLSGRARK